MNGIIDTLHLRRDELDLVVARYPHAVITNTAHDAIHRVTIAGDVCEEGYYLFLLHNGVALSSHNFCAKLQTDKRFIARMRASIAETAEAGAGDHTTPLAVGRS